MATDDSIESKYTNAEWTEFIAQTEAGLDVRQTPFPYPAIGSNDFMKTIDHTLLKLDAQSSQFDGLCSEARVNGFATVCVRPHFVERCVVDLKGTDIRVASVIGFHEGTQDLYLKLQETQRSIQAGATELDVVINYPELQAKRYASIYNELATIRLQAPRPVLLKLILETSQLTRSQIIAGCVMAAAANFDFVKTSTGFNGPGATEQNVRLMASCCQLFARGRDDGHRMLVKASGGIRTLGDAVTMLEAGASRLGTSAGVWIAKEAKEKAMTSTGPLTSEEIKGARPGLTTRLFTDY